MALTRSKLLRPLLMLAIAAAACDTGATLQPRFVHDGVAGAFYDTEMDITWLADANYAATVHAATALADGRFANEPAAQAWAASLEFGGVDGWRLPHSDPACIGIPNIGNCDRHLSEFHWMFLENLGGAYGHAVADFHNATFDRFSHIQGDWVYWSETPMPGPPAGWTFVWSTLRNQPAVAPAFPSGVLGAPYFAWPVHDGDVGGVLPPTAVPQPSTLALSAVLVLLPLLRRGLHRSRRA